MDTIETADDALDGVVEDEPADFDEWTNDEGVGPEIGYMETLTMLVTTYGWFILFGAIAVIVIWRKWLEPLYEKWQDDLHAARYHKDPDMALARMQAVEASRQRMQAEHDLLAVAHAEMMRIKEEQKRNEKIDEYEHRINGTARGTKLGSSLATDDEARKDRPEKPRLRNNEYNPLMGGGGGSSYRPPTRSCCTGGGCG